MRPNQRPVLVAFALLLACGTAAAATPTTTGLGQSWPDTADVSASGQYHVYRFEKGGVQYIQVNDLAGTVRGAVASIDGQLLELPVGVDASHWTIVPEGSAAATGETVYQGDGMKVRAAPQPTGVLQLQAEPCNPLVCAVKGP
ncbi:MAG: hypothetical protein ABW193_05010 [Luteibacter sp.]